MEIRLIGTFQEVEAVTRELRRLYTVISERSWPAKNGKLRRYLRLADVEVKEARAV
jgi:hypothetical protein